MPAPLRCPSCSRPILASPEGRLPPWCPQCGASIKSDASTIAPSRPEPVGRLGLMPTADSAAGRPFFHACVPAYSENYHQHYRIYPMASDLLLFALGIGPVVNGEIMPRTRSVFGPRGGLAGAIAEWEDAKQRQLATRIQDLDAADEPMLRTLAEAGDRGFVLRPGECASMRLGGPSFWYRWICGVGHEAVWRFRTIEHGTWKLALPSLRDARRAAEHLPRIFDNAVEVSLSWGRGR